MLKSGDPAPDFEAVLDNGETVSLSHFKGKNVVLYFYPKDNTPGCTREACDFRDNISSLEEKNTVVLGVSPDSVKSHQKFKDKFDLPFPPHQRRGQGRGPGLRRLAREENVRQDPYGNRTFHLHNRPGWADFQSLRLRQSRRPRRGYNRQFVMALPTRLIGGQHETKQS